MESTAALAEARELARMRPEGWRAKALAAAARAEAASPGWIAPRRVHDDLERELLLGHEALATRRGALDPDGTGASVRAEDAYLVGRLEGREGLARLELAARLQPDLAWAQHGLGYQRFLSGQPRGALRAARRACDLARGSYELGVFAGAEARYLLDLGERERAVERLLALLDDPRLAEPERTELSVVLARAELDAEDGPELERGFWRALALLEEGRLAEEEWDALGAALLARRSAVRQPDALSLVLAALERGQARAPGPGADRLRARLLLERGARDLAAATWSRTTTTSPTGSFSRLSDLERGEAERALESWRAALPARLLDADGLPSEARLAALVRAAREARQAGGEVRFGQALLEAGWFAEAGAWASFLARSEAEATVEAALSLEARASAGQALLAGIEGVLEHVDGERPAFAPSSSGRLAKARELRSLDDLLETLQPFFERFDGAPLALELVRSPRLSFGGIASIVHPGPRFSALDAREGRGVEGEPVPGLAAELERIGRFGIFGEAPGGGGPDGTVLRTVGGEWKRGEHLGVPFEGWVAWCEGADVESRPGRVGSSISGAALHEGYWIDLDTVRRDLERQRAAERRFLELDAATLERALEGRGPRLAPGTSARERGRWLAPLGEGERVLLAALRERPAPPPGGSRLTLDEWLEITAMHEEGHLTDRTRFLPLARKWPKALAFLVRHGFSPRGVARALEFRAQLVALCEAPEPRLVLADCLASADSEGGVLAHGEAYRELLGQLLTLASEEQERGRLPGLDREHYVLYQLHRLSAEELRALARGVARRNGMLEDG